MVRLGLGSYAYELTVDEGKPSVKRGKGEADVELTDRALSMVYLGDRSFRSLAQSGLVDGEPDTLLQADAMFNVSPAPQCLTQF